MKPFLASLAVLLGTIGLLACVGGIVASWMSRDQLTQSGLELLETVDETLAVAEDKTDGTAEAIRLIRDVVTPATRTIASLSEKGKRGTPEDERELQRIAGELSTRVRNIEKLVEAGQAIVGTVNATAKTAEKMPFSSRLVSRLSSLDNLKVSADSLDRLSAFLDKVQEALTQFRQDKEIQREIATEITRVASEVETRLATLESQVDNLQRELKGARVDVVEIRSNLASWVSTAVILLTVLLVWMGLGQWALLWCGLFHARSRTPTEGVSSGVSIPQDTAAG